MNIALELVQLNFGDLTVESEPGRGSVFTFTVPIAEPSTYIRRYLDRVQRFRGDTSHVSLVRLEATGGNSPRAMDELEKLIQYRIRRSDLVFRVATDLWLIVVASKHADVHVIIHRIEQAREEANRNRPSGPLPMIHCQMEGTWHIDDERVEFVEAFRAKLSQVDSMHV